MSAIKRRLKNSPLAVLISDIHFSISTLELASMALKDALGSAEKLDIPLIICGDTNDTKAIIRAEVANEIISILKTSKVLVYILVGNHDLINEKSTDHGLNYLSPYATIISSVSDVIMGNVKIGFIPYQSKSEDFIKASESLKDAHMLIIHQGVNGAFMGDYIQDKSSVDSDFQGKKVFSGHYHKHQTVGDVIYVGNPYTLSFGEANDGPKGYLVVNYDGSYKRHILNLRRHYIIDVPAYELRTIINHADQLSQYSKYKNIPAGSPIRLRITDAKKSDAKHFKKNLVGLALFGHESFNMELIHTEESHEISKQEDYSGKEGNEKLFDTLIDVLDIDAFLKLSLKTTWRRLAS